MRLLGREVSFELDWRPRQKASVVPSATALTQSGWFPIVREPYPGAWQRGAVQTATDYLAHHAVYACTTRIASDIGKLRNKLVQFDAEGQVWFEVRNGAHSPLLRRPNRFQNHIQFKESWMLSKLRTGNAYILKEYDSRDVVRAMYVLDPTKVLPLVADDGSVYYQVGEDRLNGVNDKLPAVPSQFIIHDRMNCIFHPLIGTSPLYAAGAAATTGITIEGNTQKFFANGANHSGILTAPGPLSQETADRLERLWAEQYTGTNSGRIAAMGDGLKFEPMTMSAVDAQLIEQLKWTAETVCSTFHVPPFKIGVGAVPAYQNAEVLNQIYYSDCLQSLIEQYEACMDDALGFHTAVAGKQYGVELDLDGLLRMDQATQVKTLTEGIKGSLYAPNEARRKLDLPPLDGGDTVYMQQQNYSLAALDARDQNDPLSQPPPAPPALAPEPEPAGGGEDLDAEEEARAARLLTNALAEAETQLALVRLTEALRQELVPEDE